MESLTFAYDDSDRLQSSVHRFGNQRLNVSYTYGTGNRLERAVYDGSSLYGDYVYTYGANSAVKTVKYNDSTLLSYRYDTLGRRIQTDIGSVVNAHYVYKNGSGGENATTTLVSTLVYPDRQYHFTYAKSRAILSVERVQGSDTQTTAYAYDSMDQLIREDNPFAGKTYVYTYDLGGNLLTKTTYAYTQPNSTPTNPLSTVTYGYDSEWHDLLTSYDGSPITYDEIGNPLSYRGSAFVWDGRQLTQATKGSETMSYVYGVNGMRLQKTYTTPTKTVTTAHSTDGAVIYADFEQTVENGETQDEYRAYFYDESGSPVGFMFHGQNYYFEKTLQGDISRIYDSEGNVVGEYLYDAWGNLLNADSLTEIAKQNPFRYRGYYFDSETGMYYLRSRYYDPQVGRFINADSYISTGQGILGNNMFAYCGNNPVNRSDATGYAWRKAFAAVDFSDFGNKKTFTSVDITEKLNNEMKANSEKMEQYVSDHSYIESAIYFANKVKPGGEWDFKSQDTWDLNYNTNYVYNGIDLRYDDIGNIHYGYVGRVLFSTDILLIAGGVVQISTHTSNWSYWKTNFDDPRDQWAISFGCYLWEEGLVS